MRSARRSARARGSSSPAIPNNPTGTILTTASRQGLAMLAEERGVWLLVDEIYRGAEIDGGEAATAWGLGPRVLVSGGLSKSFACPGLRLGWLIGPPEVVAECHRRQDYTTIGTGTLAQLIGERVMQPENRDRLLRRGRSILAGGREMVRNWLLQHNGWSWVEPQAEGWRFSVTILPMPSEEFSARLREEESVFVCAGALVRLGGAHPDRHRRDAGSFARRAAADRSLPRTAPALASATGWMSRPELAVELSSAVLDLGGHRVLDHLSLQVAAGEKVVLFGPSGGGKSSVLRCILGLETLSAGAVRVFGTDITNGDPKALRLARRRTATIFQHFNLFTMKTALDNVALGAVELGALSRADARKLARDLLHRVGVGRLADHYPFQLSGGEQQRVAIARALATEPKLLLLDEPTSALDPELVKGLLELISEITRDRTVICVTHELGFARRLADRVVFLADGRVGEEGRPEDVLDRPALGRVQAFLRARQPGSLPAVAGADSKLGG